MAVTSPTGNIFADAATLAAHAYDDTSDADTALGWQQVEAATLGLAPTGSFSGGTYEFRDGIYVGTDRTNSAVAHVSIGELNGESTLAIAFRGTDEIPGDLGDHLHFADHLAQFAPLLAAVDDFADDPAQGIDTVLITGHSLGSAMVSTAMVEQGWVNDPKYLGIAIASHGTDASIAATAPAEVDNVVNFIHTQDFLVLAREDGLPANTIADLIGAGRLVGGETDFEPKARIGTDVWIETGNAARLVQEATDGRFEDPVTAEHRIGRYEADIATLATEGDLEPATLLADDAPRYFVVGTEDADLLVQHDRDLFPTQDFDQRIHGGGGVDRLGGAGGDDFIDGGAGTDTAHFRGGVADYAVTTESEVTTVEPLGGGAFADGTDMLIDVEVLRFADAEVSLSGALPTAADIEPERPAITVDNLVDQTDVTLAGVGDEIAQSFDHVF